MELNSQDNKIELNAKGNGKRKQIVLQIILFSLIAVMLGGAVFLAVYISNNDIVNTTVIDGVVYTNEGTYWAVNGVADEKQKEVVLREYIDNMPVKSIDKFINSRFVESIVISKTIERIDCSFEMLDYLENIIVDSNNNNYCSVMGVLYSKDKSVLIRYPSSLNLQYMENKIANEVSYISDYAFSKCRYISVIKLPEKVLRIGKLAFFDSSVSEINFNESLISIGEKAFYQCNMLRVISIPSNVELIESGAFANCASLVNYNVSYFNNYFRSVNGILYSKDMQKLIAYPPAINGDSFRIKEGINTIGQYAFALNQHLCSIYIPSGLASIGENAFTQTNSLKALIIDGDKIPDIHPLDSFSTTTNVYVAPEMVSSYKNDDSWKLSQIYPYHTDSSMQYLFMTVKEAYENDYMKDELIENGIFENANACILTGYTKSSNIVICPDVCQIDGVEMPVVAISNRAFISTQLKEISLGDNIVYIADESFYLYSYLEKVEINASLKAIGNKAFMNCVQLSQLTFKANLNELNEQEFNLVSIGESAFRGCSSLVEVVFYRNQENSLYLGRNAFRDCMSLGSILTDVMFIYDDAIHPSVNSDELKIYVFTRLYNEFLSDERYHKQYWQIDSDSIIDFSILNEENKDEDMDNQDNNNIKSY